MPAKPFNVLAKKYGLKEYKNFIEVLEGDYTLLADIPQWAGLKKLRPNLHFIGPLPYKSNEEVPKEILVPLKQAQSICFFLTQTPT